MVVAGHHMFRPEIHKRNNIDTGYFLNIALVTLGDAVSKQQGAGH